MKAAILGSGLLALSVMPSAFASGNDPVDMVDGARRIPLSLHEAKSKCMELTANQQLRPFTIKVECKRERTFWLEEKSSLRLSHTFSFSGKALIKNLYEIKPEAALDESQMLVKECPRFAEYKQEMEAWQLVDVPDCKALNQIENLSAHCKEVLGTDTNLQELSPEPTGRTIDTCAVQVPVQRPSQLGNGQTPGQNGQAPSQLGNEQTPGQNGQAPVIPSQGPGQGQFNQNDTDEEDTSAVAANVINNFGAQLSSKSLSTSTGTVAGLEVRGRINLNTLAGRLGLSERDVVTRVNGVPVVKVADMANALSRAYTSDKVVKMTVWRASTSRWTFVEARM